MKILDLDLDLTFEITWDFGSTISTTAILIWSMYIFQDCSCPSMFKVYDKVYVQFFNTGQHFF